MISSGTILLGILIVIAYYLFFKKDERRNPGQGKIPPGPRTIPFFGNLFQLDRSIPLMTFTKWAKEHGDVYKMNLGKPGYVFSDYKMVKELFADSAFSSRMDLGDSAAMYEGSVRYGLVNTSGDHWEQLRRFTLRQLRDFGFGKNTMETLIMEELNEVQDWLKINEGKPIGEIKKKMTLAVVNSLWTILSGKRYSHDDPTLQTLTSQIDKVIIDAAESGGLIFFMPNLAKIIPEWSGYNTIRKIMEGFKKIFKSAVDEHKATHSEDFQRDFIDVFIKENKNCKDSDAAFYGNYGERQLIGVLSDLFLAGSDTTSTTLDWIFLYLSTFPEIQGKLQKEIEGVTGGSRPVSVADRPNLPYAEAVLAEVLRYSSIVPVGVPHMSTVDREFHGYFIPKGIGIFANMHFIHHDDRIWGDSENFRPERFIDQNGQFKKHEALIPFSIGRRQCAGETLARDTLFLYMTNIFQRFQVKLDPNTENPGLQPKNGFSLNPKNYKVVATDRAA